MKFVSIGQAASEKEVFKSYRILYLYIAQEQGQIASKGKILIVTIKFYFVHCKFQPLVFNTY